MTVEMLYKILDSTDKEKLRKLVFDDMYKSRRDARASLMDKTELDDMEASIPLLLRQASDAFELLYAAASSLLDGSPNEVFSVSVKGMMLTFWCDRVIIFDFKDGRVCYKNGMFTFNEKDTVRIQYETCCAMIDFLDDNSERLLKAIDEKTKAADRPVDRPSKTSSYKVR